MEKTNKRKIFKLVILIFIISLIIIQKNQLIPTSKAEEVSVAAELLKLTTTEQETDYSVTIGSTKYTINTIDTLVNADLALLEWKSKGSEDNRTLKGTFNGVTYSTYDEIYAQIYTLLLNSATKSFASGSNLSTDTAISKTTIWKISGTVSTQSGFVTCPGGNRLIIVANGSATLKYAAEDTRINIGRESATDSGSIAFQGKSSSTKLTIKGRGSSAQTYSAMILKSGKLYINNVNIKEFTFNGGETALINLPPDHDAARYMYMSNTTISDNSGRGAGAIYCRAYFSGGSNTENEKSRLYLYNNKFTNCVVVNSNSEGTNMGNTNGGGAIRSYAADNTGLYVEKCTFDNNKAGTGTASTHVTGSGGGAIYWKSVGNRATFKNCTFTNNSTTSVGGAVYNTGKMEIIGCTFENNKANYGGGAIAVEPPVTSNVYENIDVNNLSGSLTIDENTSISNNESGKYGGGIFFNALEGKIDTAITKYEMELNINGANINNNTSTGYGGGVAMYLNYKQHNYKTGIIINEKSTLTANTATNGGGAIWMGNSETCVCTSSEGVVMNGGTLEENTAKIGGSICIQSSQESVPMNFYMNNGIVQNNTSTSNGGAVYISNGNFIMNDGDIQHNSANNNGGTIYLEKGNVNINNGSINNGTATNGGGIYISGGDMQLENGEVNGCQATFGGGIYISDGNVTMNGGSISNNQATSNGGGIFASSDTQDLNITITSGEIIGNIASGHGGGVGVDMGTGLSAKVVIGLETCNGLDETHSHPVIKDNTANERGGGFCLHGDSLDIAMYCGSINTNIAIREPGSANINQTGGIVTVHGGTVSGGITVIGGDYIYVPGQLSKVGVTYNSNIPGSTQIEQAEITPGVIISLPKNLFTREGYILVGWSTNQTLEDSDTIYPAGELYTVPDESVVLYSIWLLEGAGSIETPAIKSGKIYEEFTGDISVMISSDSAFTTVMSVLDMQPSLYKERTIDFSNNLKNGTTIMMIDLTNKNNRQYYYYKVENDETNTITLSSFKKMGEETYYIDSVKEENVDEKFIFIVDLANDNTTTNSTEMTFTRYSADEKIASIEQNVSFTTTMQRSFDFIWTNESENLVLGDTINLSYEPVNANVGESRYEGRKMAIVIEGKEKQIPNESKLTDGTNNYSLNSNGQFVIPLEDVTKSKDIVLNLESKPLLANEQGCSLKAELWVSANEDSENPFMGEKVATIDNIVLNAVALPAFKVEMKDRLYRINSFDGEVELNYVSKNIENCEVTLEVQKKNGGIYETQENILTEVSNSTSNQNGIFTLDVTGSGKIRLNLENSNLGIGTYRVLVKIMTNEQVVHTIPYNFIILE